MRMERRPCLIGGALLLAFAGTVSARADEKADALLKEVVQATRAVKTLTADLTLVQESQGSVLKITGKVTLKKPNLARIELTGKPFDQTLASDGQYLWTLTKASNRVTKTEADAEGRNIQALWAYPIACFFAPTMLTSELSPAFRSQFVGKETIDGSAYQVVTLTAGSNPIVKILRLYIGTDKRITRMRIEVPAGNHGTITQSAILTHIQFNAPLPASLFAYKPPQNATIEETASDSGLLPIGRKAPDFALPTPAGERIALQEVLKNKKAVLLNFWYCVCPGCREELPRLSALYKELKGKGLELIAINRGDSKALISKYVNENKFPFKIVLGGEEGPKRAVFRDYGVQAYPANVLLNSKGKVVYSALGFDEAALRAALAKLGVK